MSSSAYVHRKSSNNDDNNERIRLLLKKIKQKLIKNSKNIERNSNNDDNKRKIRLLLMISLPQHLHIIISISNNSNFSTFQTLNYNNSGK